MAMLELKIIALPMPCISLYVISIVPVLAIAHNSEAMVNTMFPIKNIFFRPIISDSLPKGTRKIAEVKRYDIITQLIDTELRDNSWVIFGKAMLTALPRKGVKKEVTMVTTSITVLLSTTSFCCGSIEKVRFSNKFVHVICLRRHLSLMSLGLRRH